MKKQTKRIDWENQSPSFLSAFLLDYSSKQDSSEVDAREYLDCFISCSNDPVLRAKAIKGLLDAAEHDETMRAWNAVRIIGMFEDKSTEPALLKLFRSKFPKSKIKTLASIPKGITEEGCLLSSLVSALINTRSVRGIKIARYLNRVFSNTDLAPLILLELRRFARDQGRIEPELESAWQAKADPRLIEIEKGTTEGIPFKEIDARARKILKVGAKWVQK